MFIAALLVGGLTAFYFGLRTGAFAAGASLLAFLAAAVVPGVALWTYALVACGVIGVLTIGPRRADPTHAARATRLVKQGLAALRARLRLKK